MPSLGRESVSPGKERLDEKLGNFFPSRFLSAHLLRKLGGMMGKEKRRE